MMTKIAHIQMLATARQHRFLTPYSYRVPDTWQIEVGNVVYVPLGKQLVIGVVIEITHTDAPSEKLKPIHAQSTIYLHAQHLQLAHWIARHYLSHVADVLYAFLPHHGMATPQRQWLLTDAGRTTDLHGIPPDEREVLYALRPFGVVNESQIEQIFLHRAVRARTLIKLLADRGYVQLNYILAPPDIAPAQMRMITLSNPNVEAKHAPAQHAIIAALIAASHHTLPAHTFSQKSALRILIERGNVTESLVEVPPETPLPLPAAIQLTQQQTATAQTVIQALGTHAAYLIHGVTGSGKTEVYCAIIREVIARGAQTLVLIPEIALTTQLATRFAQRFPGRIVVLHGQLTPNQRTQRWHAIQRRQYDVIIGPRSALFAPIQHIGLIVVDEEHDTSYKSDVGIKYHARDSAMMYAKLVGCPIVLGSATPSVELIAAAHDARIHRLDLPERIDVTQQVIPRPPIRIVDLRTEATIDPFGLLGTTLTERIHSHVAAKHHVLLLLNRRGSISARICRNCSATVRCTTCSTPLVVHMRQKLAIGVCHTCGKNSYVNDYCHACFHREFLDIGSGTQRLHDIVSQHWPTTPVIRWDSDTADSMADHQRLLADVQTHECAIIVGTQMIAKGFDIANIRLVGVVNTDTALHLPDIRAAERTYQLLTQVAGRAGRRAGDAEVIFQTYTPEHYAIHAAARYDSDWFYTQELRYRKKMQYPPYTRLIKLVWTHRDMRQCETLARRESAEILDQLHEFGDTTRVIGPAPCFFTRIRSMYRWQAIISTTHLRGVLGRIAQHTRATIDVEPISLL
ncbi:MAG: primosomal protein N' [Roseiflexaceae bacterium]